MAQPTPHPKAPIDALQAYINAIFIETGKALRPLDKEGGKTMANSNLPRLRLTIPNVIEQFHQALDEIEADIIRAKSVLGRDLEELRSKRIAQENPLPLNVVKEATPEIQPTPPPITLSENISKPIELLSTQKSIPMATTTAETVKQPQVKDESSEESVIKEEAKDTKILSPPSSNDTKSQVIGLGINTTAPALTDSSAPATADGPDSSVDSLFDMPDSANNHISNALGFDNMDFTMPDSNANTQPQQAQNTDFDLSTFGNNPQDFNMNDLQPTNDTGPMPNINNVASDSTNTKQEELSTDDFLNMTGSGANENNNDNLDLDLNLGNMVGAEDSTFDDLFFGGDDDGNMGGDIGEMEHGQFDNAFFGIDEV